jgi:hypothetical protein
MWANGNLDYSEINSIWESKLKNNKTDLESQIIETIKNKNIVIVLDSYKKVIYGLYSPSFTKINSYEFRSEFIRCYQNYGIPLIDKKYKKTAYGELIEKFTFNSNLPQNNEAVKLEVHIIYGLNNGYSSFRFKIGRTILVCENGLTEIESRKLTQLKHTNNASIPLFIERIKNDLTKYNLDFQNKISVAKSRTISEVKLKEFYSRIHVGSIVKDRIKKRLETEIKLYGSNEWALSQSLTNLATHFYKKGADMHHEKILMETGSDIIDYSLETILDFTVKEEYYGEYKTYGNFLPKSYLL